MHYNMYVILSRKETVMTEYKILDIADVANEKFKTLSEEEQLKVVDEALESVSNTISDIYNKQDELYELRKELQDSILAKKTALFNLQVGSIIVGFVKHMDYHYTMVEAYYIKKMSTRMDKLDVISYTYRVDDGEIGYKIIPKSISKSTIFSSALPYLSLIVITSVSKSASSSPIFVAPKIFIVPRHCNTLEASFEPETSVSENSKCNFSSV